MKLFSLLLGILLLLGGCTAPTESILQETPIIEEPGGVLATRPPTETAVAVPTSPAEETMTPEMEPVTPVEVDLGKLTPVPPEETTPIEQPRPGVPDTATKLISEVSQDLARRLNVDVQDVALESYEGLDWPDGSLGCPEPGMGYTMALVRGYRITLTAGGETYDYHAAASGYYVLCGSDGRPVPQN